MRFRVLSYNIHKAIGRDREFRPDRIAAILEHYNADIVLLQEVDRAAPRSNHTDLASLLARSLGLEYRAVGMNVYLKKGMYGNATLTRFPIGRQRNINLTQSWRKRRGAQHTSITLSGGKSPLTVDVFNVHLGLSATERLKQVSQLLSSADMEKLNGALCIVAGDMNDWRGALYRQRFSKVGFSCATNRRPGSRWSIKTFPSFAPAGGLDKIFYRGDLRCVRAFRSRLLMAEIASDHLPIVADFEA